MKLSVFARQAKSKDGRAFTAYVGKLHKRDGSEITVSVRFRQECGSPKAEDCPCNIEFDKQAANLTASEYVREDTGEIGTSYKLWISDWTMSAEKYVDHSLDDFE